LQLSTTKRNGRALAGHCRYIVACIAESKKGAHIVNKPLVAIFAIVSMFASESTTRSADAKPPAGYKRYAQKLDKTGVSASILLPEKATEMKVLNKKYEVSNTGNLPGGSFWSLHLYDTGADKALRIAKSPKERYDQTKEDSATMYEISEAKAVKLGNHEGLEYSGVAKANKNAVFTSRTFVVKGTLVIVTVTKFGADKPEELRHVLDSLEVKE
jgi:hypothetical protein